MLGKIVGLKFMDHEITDEYKLSNLSKKKYFCMRSVPGIGAIMLEKQEWETELEKAYIEHVGNSNFRAKFEENIV
jgi:hypothetical protein